MATVYVLSKNGKPLMPTTRCGHVRHLLKQKKARVVDAKPFTIQLLYDCEEGTQPIVLGIDPGRTNIGLCAVREDTGEPVFTAQVETRNKEIPKLMANRKAFRQKHRSCGRRKVRQRRACAHNTNSPKCEKQEAAQSGNASKQAQKIGIIKRPLPGCEEPVLCIGIKNKEARFNNRIRPAGWLTPTANQLLQTHINIVNKVKKFLPVTDVVLEVNKFAFMALDNPHIQKWMYQRGPLKGYGSVEGAVFAQQDGHCIFCKKEIANYHHIVPQSKHGSNTIDNIVGLCAKHHDKVHKEIKWEEKLKIRKNGLNKKYDALSVLNQIIQKLCDAFAVSFGEHFFVTDGQSTKAFRDENNIQKDHHLDAFCISSSILPKGCVANAPAEKNVFRIKQFRRHDRQAVQQAMLDRKYYLDGKLVATNRHKAIEQKSDSLEEFVARGGDVSQLVMKEHGSIYKRLDRWMPGSIVSFDGTVGVLNCSQGFHNGKVDYFFNTKGERFLSKKCVLLAHPTGLVVV